jgi:hypothetical protein
MDWNAGRPRVSGTWRRMTAAAAAIALAAAMAPAALTPASASSASSAGAAAPAVAHAAAPLACSAPSPGAASCQTVVSAASGASGVARAAQAGSSPSGYGPAQLQAAYQLPSSSEGAGHTVAVVAPFDDPDVASDLAIYRTQYGLPACPQTTSASSPQCFTEYNESGVLLTPGNSGGVTGSTTWALQTSAQLDAISATCPNCDLLLVEVNSASISDIGAGVNWAVSKGATVITIGAVEPETNNDPTLDQSYFNQPGVAIDVAAGQGGYGVVNYPAASEYVTAVGGTTLTPSGTGSCTAALAGARGYCEQVWNDASGATASGCSQFDPEPSWQSAGLPAADTGCAGERTVADVSADADPATGIAVYDSDGEGDWQGGTGVGGTTVAAAIVAGITALAGTPATDGDPASLPYASPGGFNDVTTGTNGTCTPAYLCTAGTGYDGPTGLGTPAGVSGFDGSYYQPVTPARLMDTRNGTGGTVGPVASDSTTKLQVTGVGGVPSANVTAVAVNLTVVDQTEAGFLTVYPDGITRPITSSLDYKASTTLANLVIMPVGADGKIDIYNASGGTTQLLADVFGYFTSDASAAGDTTYTPITATRILDTRNGTGAAKAKLAAGGTLAIKIGGANGIPSGVSAVAINFTAVDDSGAGLLIDYADGTAVPAVSNLQFNTATVAEMAIVPVGADGKIDIHAGGTGSTDVVGDVSGYFTKGTAGEKYHAIAPTRLIDTRSTKAVAADGTLAVAEGPTVVAPAADLVLNVTAVESTTGGDLIVYPAGAGVPGASNLNYSTGVTTANLALGATGGGDVDIHNGSAGTVQVVVDCFGYFSAG